MFNLKSNVVSSCLFRKAQHVCLTIKVTAICTHLVVCVGASQCPLVPLIMSRRCFSIRDSDGWFYVLWSSDLAFRFAVIVQHLKYLASQLYLC